MSTNTAVYEIADVKHPSVAEVVGALEPDLIVTSCFPSLIPGDLLGSTRCGGLNLHPSLLPRYRGPDPLFWIYRDGIARTGVTIHHLSGGFDSGDIVSQHEFELPHGLPGGQLEQRCAEIGAQLLVDATTACAGGKIKPTPQDERAASYQSWPVEDDLLIGDSWAASHAWHFVQGVVPLGYHPLIEVGETTLVIRRALDFEPGQHVEPRLAKAEDRVMMSTPDGLAIFQVTEHWA